MERCPLHRPPSEAGLFEVGPLTRAWLQHPESTILVGYDDDMRKKKKKVRTRGWLTMKLCMLAFLAASMTSSMEGVLELSPYAMFSEMVMLKRIGSCETSAICERNHLTFSDCTLTPSTSCRNTNQWSE